MEEGAEASANVSGSRRESIILPVSSRSPIDLKASQIRATLRGVALFSYKYPMRDFINIINQIVEGYWGQVGRTRIVILTTHSDLKRLMKSINRNDYGVDVRGHWNPETDTVIGFSGWNLTHDEVEREYPELRSAVRITFFHDNPRVLGTGRADKHSSVLMQSNTLRRIIGENFTVEDAY